jgi:hypothetical protein
MSRAPFALALLLSALLLAALPLAAQPSSEGASRFQPAPAQPRARRLHQSLPRLLDLKPLAGR